MTTEFLRYLQAKKSVDDRALNVYVWQAMADVIKKRPCRILEIGAGIGTMLDRFAAHNLLEAGSYTAIDKQPGAIAQAKQRLLPQLKSHTIHLEAIDLFDFIAREAGKQSWDVVIAHAFLDLMDIQTTLPRLFSLLQPEGFFYFSLNFDGATIFEPTIEPAFDALIESLYHRTMDERLTNGRLSGDSRSGRHLFELIPQAGGQILAAGSSDWVVFPGINGYPDDEAYFLQFIITTVARALENQPELDQEKLKAWVQQRLAQIEAKKLVYIAHQIDFWGQLTG